MPRKQQKTIAVVDNDKVLNQIASKMAENVLTKDVTITFRIEQVTSVDKYGNPRNPFVMQTSIKVPANKVTLIGLANKTAHALADSLYNVCEKALQAKEQHGKYLTAFRPKAVFKVIIETDSNVSFHAVSTKGLDAIRLVQKDKLIPRTLLVQKLQLLAEVSKANQSFGQMIAFENKTLQLA